MIEDNTHTDDFKRKTHCANVGIRQKLIVRILEFYKNSVSKYLENKKLNVLDMGYTLFYFMVPGSKVWNHDMRIKGRIVRVRSTEQFEGIIVGNF